MKGGRGGGACWARASRHASDVAAGLLGGGRPGIMTTPTECERGSGCRRERSVSEGGGKEARPTESANETDMERDAWQ